MIFYILLTYGVRPSGQILAHPAAKSQLRFYKELISKNDIQEYRFLCDYARKASSLNDLPKLKRWLEASEKADNGTVFIDDIARLIKVSDMKERVDFMEELRVYDARIFSLKHRRTLADFSGQELRDLILHANNGKHPAQQLRHQDTQPARRSSVKTRSANAVQNARSLADLRDELIAAHGRATLQEISDEATARGLKSSRGNKWTPQNVARALKLLERKEHFD